MKNIIKITLVAVAMLGLTNANAAKKVDVTVTEGSSMINISLVGASVGEVLTIKSFKGAAVFKKVFTTMMNFEKNVNLGGVKNGVYLVEVENNNKLEITPVLKNDLGVTLIAKAVKVFNKPQFKNANGKITFALLNPDANQVDITVQTDAVVISEEKGISNLEINRTFDITKLGKGIYSVVVKSGSRTFVEDFNIK